MIYLDEPEITPSDRAAVYAELQHYPFSTSSPTVDIFERALAHYLDVPETVCVNNGTAALHLALLASGVKPGDEVVLPALTFIGTANAVKACGASPIFCDVDLDTWCIDFSQINASASKNTKCILPVQLYGNPYHKACKTRFPEIVDGAEALGSYLRGVDVAKHYDANVCPFVCFSFNGNKILTTGAGGLVVGNDLSTVRLLANQGRDREGECIIPGFNYRMTGMEAALGLSQLYRLPKYIAKKRRFNEIYRNELPMLKFQEPTPNSIPNWWFTSALFPEGIDIILLQAQLKKEDIPTRRIFMPIHLHSAYETKRNLPNSEYIWDHGLCLPSSVRNSEKDIADVCEIIKRKLNV